MNKIYYRTKMRYFICLGSNIGDRKKNIRQACLLLQRRGIHLFRSSSLYLSEPVDYRPQPWFYNQVVELESDLEPHELLSLVKAVEKVMGRKPSLKKGPRLIDIDILFAGEKVVNSRELVVPHPRLEKRNFVLLPLSEIGPDIVHPVSRKKVKDLLKECDDNSSVVKLDG
ncbi:MAG: 2-amino-4-hydroxy-6-hydroxymethyldihydropteridine diphosphokinase [Candidatus Aminicenantales bacterium]